MGRGSGSDAQIAASTCACRLCGTTSNLTRHHLLKKRSARLVRIAHGLRNRTVWLCRSCHDRFHSGPPEDRRAAWDELLPLLTEKERRLYELRPLGELWESKL